MASLAYPASFGPQRYTQDAPKLSDDLILPVDLQYVVLFVLLEYRLVFALFNDSCRTTARFGTWIARNELKSYKYQLLVSLEHEYVLAAAFRYTGTRFTARQALRNSSLNLVSVANNVD